MKTFSIAIHGGAGTLVKGLMTQELEAQYKNTLKVAREAGFEVLKNWLDFLFYDFCKFFFLLSEIV